MFSKLPQFYSLSTELLRAQSINLPVVALESAVITHGLPYPENIKLARDIEKEIRSMGAIPATIAVLDGRVCIGLNDAQLERLATDEERVKISSRDLGPAIAQKRSGGTTVAGTLAAAQVAGIRVFATGGIGGVHRQPDWVQKPAYDVSADLIQLAHTPLIVVCAGAKAILDLPATLEELETLCIPVVGYETDYFPAFYSRSSGLRTSARANTPEEVVKIAAAHWDIGLDSAILVAVPPPVETALPNEKVDSAIQQALGDAYDKGIRGQEVTPYLLKRVSDLTQGESLRSNLALLLNNARVAAAIARYLIHSERQ